MASLRMLAAGAVLTGGLLMATATQASVTFYTTQAAFNGAATTSLLEDFSTAPVKDAPLPSLTLHGVTYTGFAGSPFPNVWVSSPGYTNYGADVGTTTEDILTANGDEDIVAAFSTTYVAVGFNAYFNGLGDGVLSVFGPSSTLLGALTFSGGFDPATGLADRGYLGFVSTTPVASFRWTTTHGGVLNTGFTNISVGQAQTRSVTPEPTAWSLMVIGFLGLGAALRRRETHPLFCGLCEPDN
jgi:hypothetical protein